MSLDFSKIIRFHRKQSHLTQIELARLAGVGKTAVFDIENGKRTVRFDTLAKVCNVLNIQIKFDSPLMSLIKEDENEES